MSLSALYQLLFTYYHISQTQTLIYLPFLTAYNKVLYSKVSKFFTNADRFHAGAGIFDEFSRPRPVSVLNFDRRPDCLPV